MIGCLLSRTEKSAATVAGICVTWCFFVSGCGKFGYDPNELDDDDDVIGTHDGGRDGRWNAGSVDAAWVWDATGRRDAGQCNDVPNARLTIREMNVASSLPSPGGGTIGGGRYYLVKREIFTGSGGASGPTGHMYREALELRKVSGAELDPWHLLVQRVQSIDGGGEQRETLVATPLLSLPNHLVKDPSCGPSRPTTLAYFATPSTLVLFDPTDFSASTFRWDAP